MIPRAPHAPPVVAALLVAVGCGVVGGCGYRPLLRDATAPAGVRRIQVPLLENRTDQVGLESELTGVLIDRLDRYRGVQVSAAEDAEAVLRGSIRSTTLRPTTAVADEGLRHQGFRVAIVVDLRLERADSDEVLWQAVALRREAEYVIGTLVAGEDILAAEELRRRALFAAGERALEEGVELMMGGG